MGRTDLPVVADRDHFFQLVEVKVPGRRAPALCDRCEHGHTSAFSKRVRNQGA